MELAMAAGKGTLGFDNFNTFTGELDQYCNASGTLMEMPLLHLVKNAFGYRTITLSRYQNDQFCGVEILGNLNVHEARESYLREFQRRDPFAAHIGRAQAANPGLDTLQSSEVFANNYFHNDYYRFLRTYGVWWALSMPVDEYRLTVYKHDDEADFSREEREALKLLSSVLRSRYNAQQQIQSQKAAGDAQSRLLDSMGIGFISAGHDMRLTGCNQNAADFLHELGRSNSLQYCFDQLHNLLRHKGLRKPGIHPLVTLEHLDRSIAMEIIEGQTEADGVYSITIMPHQPAEGGLLLQDTAGQFGLTERELEIGRMLVSGKSYQEAADALYVSINTVRTHVRNIYKKTGINNQRMLGQLLR